MVVCDFVFSVLSGAAHPDTWKWQKSGRTDSSGRNGVLRLNHNGKDDPVIQTPYIDVISRYGVCSMGGNSKQRRGHDVEETVWRAS